MTEGWTDKYSKNGTNRVMQSEVIQRRKKKSKYKKKILPSSRISWGVPHFSHPPHNAALPSAELKAPA